jgi:hypothetical protein
VQGVLGSGVECVNVSLNRWIEGEGEAALQLARTIRGESQLFFTDEFNLRIVKKSQCAGDVTVVVDIVLLSGIVPWVVAHPVFLYSGQ